MNMCRVLPSQKQVLIILRSLRHGGAEKCSVELAKALYSQGYTVHLALMEPVYNIKEIPAPIQIHEIGSRKTKEVQAWLEQFNQEHDLSLIMTTEIRIELCLPDIDIYYALHIVPSERIDGGWLRQLKKRYRWKQRLNGKNIIAISAGVYQDVMEVICAKPKSMCVIGDTFDFDTINHASQQTPSYALPEEYLLYVGRLCPTKRLDRLFRVYKKSRSQLPLVIIGDGESCKDSKTLVESLGLTDKVIFLGWQSNPYPAIRNASSLLVTSDSESFSAVVVEALFLNTPVVSTDCVGPKEIMGNTLKEFVVPKQDEEKFAQQLSYILENGQPNISMELKQRFGFATIASQFKTLLTA